jgi:hypothetical protein
MSSPTTSRAPPPASGRARSTALVEHAKDLDEVD